VGGFLESNGVFSLKAIERNPEKKAKQPENRQLHYWKAKGTMQ